MDKNPIKELENRKIISVVAETGNNRKSTFFKYLVDQYLFLRLIALLRSVSN